MDPTVSAQIKKTDLPQHVAIIMDGNGRWAKRKGKDRTFGHQNAIKSIKSVLEACEELGIPYLTLFAFSTENWKRPKTEVSFLMKLMAKTIRNEIDELHEKGIRLLTIGDIDELPSGPGEALKEAIRLTAENKKATLIMALNYGSKTEILQAAKKIADRVSEGELKTEEINEEVFGSHLYTAGIPDVDLLIRTSGETRISNFLLWQIAYAELYFTKVLWPDFRKEHFKKAVESYSSRERRYGRTGEQINKG